MNDSAKKSLELLFSRYPALESCRADVIAAAETVCDAYHAGGKLIVCGNGGNVFTFVSNYKKVSFPEAVSEVAKIIGKPIDIDLAPKKVSRFQPYYDLLGAMISYCSYLLTASKLGEKAMTYLNNRGLEKDVIEYFNIGLDPHFHIIGNKFNNSLCCIYKDTFKNRHCCLRRNCF